MKVVLCSVPILTTQFPPISLAILSSELRSRGHSVKCFDFNIDACHKAGKHFTKYWEYQNGGYWHDANHYNNVLRPELFNRLISEWVELISKEEPLLIGISINNSQVGTHLAQALKHRLPHVPIVAGGPQCSIIYKHAAARPSSWFDLIVSGEGDYTLVDIVESFEAQGKLVPVIGTSYKDKHGQIKYTGNRPPVIHLDSLHCPDFSDFDLNLYGDVVNDKIIHVKMLPYQTSRGCVATCHFCADRHLQEGVFRQKTGKKIAEDLIYLKNQFNNYDFCFVELISNGNHRKLMELAKVLYEEKETISFWGHMRISSKLTLEDGIVLRKSGLRHVTFGLESASDSVLKKMRKGYNSKIASNCIKNVHNAGITISINIIVGYPDETIFNFLETLWFVIRHRRYLTSIPSVCDCNASPGTDLFNEPDKFGIILNPNNPSVDWITKDGKNTLKRRLVLKKIMSLVFYHIFNLKFSGARVFNPNPLRV